MQEHFQKGIDNPFSVLKAISVESDLNSLQTHYYVHQRLDDIKEDIIENNLYNVFVFPFKFDNNDVPNTS